MTDSNKPQGDAPEAAKSVFARLLASRKFVVVLIAVAAITVLVAIGRATYQEMIVFLTVTVPAFVLAVGGEDAAQKFKNGQSVQSNPKDDQNQ